MAWLDWEEVIIDLFPPYDFVLLAFISTAAIKCPQCSSTFYKKDIGMINHTDYYNCRNCSFSGQYLHWRSSLVWLN